MLYACYIGAYGPHVRCYVHTYYKNNCNKYFATVSKRVNYHHKKAHSIVHDSNPKYNHNRSNLSPGCNVATL